MSDMLQPIRGFIAWLLGLLGISYTVENLYLVFLILGSIIFSIATAIIVLRGRGTASAQAPSTSAATSNPASSPPAAPPSPPASLFSSRTDETLRKYGFEIPPQEANGSGQGDPLARDEREITTTITTAQKVLAKVSTKASFYNDLKNRLSSALGGSKPEASSPAPQSPPEEKKTATDILKGG